MPHVRESARSSSVLPSFTAAEDAYLLNSWIPPVRKAERALWERARIDGPSCMWMTSPICTSWTWTAGRQELSYSR
jgi:hypothetical protein